jgi:hypothetical protein
MKHPPIYDQLESHRINSEVFDEIRPILAENKRLRAALLKIEQETIDHFAVGIARAALSLSSQQGNTP